MIKLYKIGFFPSFFCILKLVLNPGTDNPYDGLASEIVRYQGEFLAHLKSSSLTPSSCTCHIQLAANSIQINPCLCPDYPTFTVLGPHKCFLKLLSPKWALHLLQSYFSSFFFLKKKLINLFCCFRAAPLAYGGSQARGQIGAAAARLHQSHSNARSKPCLQPTPQLMATLDS